MIQMSLEHQQYMESLGYVISEKYDGRRGKTYTYVTHPTDNPNDPNAGQTLKYFPNLSLLTKEDVDDGEFVDLSWYATPKETFIPSGCSASNGGECYWVNGEVWYESMTLENGEVAIIGWIFGAILIIIVAYAITTLLCQFIEKVNAPCSIQEEWINKPCWKIVRAPDCQWREFNSCAGPDENNDGFPDGEFVGDWKKDIWDPSSLIWAIVIGAVAIGGVVVAVKVLPDLLKKKEPEIKRKRRKRRK